MFDKNKRIIGVDIGNVISRVDIGNFIPRTNTGGDGHKSHLQHQIKGAFEGVRELCRRFDGQVCLVSKCGPVTQVRTREWFARTLFYDVTGVNPNHVFFCEKREQKALICSHLGVTDFIDDRLEVLGYLKTVPRKFLFCPNEKEVARNKQHLSMVNQVDSWEELLQVIW